MCRDAAGSPLVQFTLNAHLEDTMRCGIGLGSSLALAALLAVPPLAPAGGQQASRPVVEQREYGKFETLLSPVLSPDGTWLAYGIRRVSEEEELRIRPLDRDTTRIAPFGTAPRFSPDSRRLAWLVGVSPAERERLRKEDEPVRTKAGILDLGTGEERVLEAVQAMGFDATGRYLALHGYAPEEPKGRGADLQLLDLETGEIMTFGGVSEYAWSPRGTLLALALSTGTTAHNGVQVYDASSQRLRQLDGSPSAYRRLAWRKDATDLAFLRSLGPEGADSTEHTLLAWQGLDAAQPEALILDLGAAGAPDTLVLVGHRPPAWTEDGGRISLGLRPRPRLAASDTVASDTVAPGTLASDTVKTRAGNVELPAVQIWHTSDVRIIPGQQAQRQADARRTLLAVWTPERNRVVMVGTALLESAVITNDGRYGIERVAEPYPWGAMFGRRYHDAWSVDLDTGRRTLVFERARYTWESPGGRYLLTFDGSDYWTHDLRSGTRTNVTVGLPATFADTLYDTPTDLPPPHGVGGWLADDVALLLYDQQDVWRVAPDGSGGERLTRGREEEIVHRLVRIDTAADAFDPAKPLYLSVRGEWTGRRGYARIVPGEAPRRLIFEDRMVSALTRADSVDLFLFRREARDVSPDLFVAGPDISSPRQVTRTNPFLADYAWTRSELVDFISEAGIRLQGVLLYPVNHDPDQRYPLIVYTYEKLTPQMHQFQVPSERSYYNFTAWTQHGYFVLLPDIVYRARDPGVSAMEAVRPAVATVVDRGLVDAERVGLIGHSWGGYQATYLPTRTDMFAASVAGAPLTDFVSFMGEIHWAQGIPEPDHWETGQARMEVPYWEDPEAHHRNSPLHAAHEMETPLLMAFGNKDGTVEFFQGTVFYNYARRAGKQMVLLVYEEESHSFQNRANATDYHRRILEWFGHYLKGEKAPSWITDGVPLIDHEPERRRVAESGGG
jgi:dipeptidyl aminopeptidase/acylaminoacyl peptidase